MKTIDADRWAVVPFYAVLSAVLAAAAAVSAVPAIGDPVRFAGVLAAAAAAIALHWAYALGAGGLGTRTAETAVYYCLQAAAAGALAALGSNSAAAVAAFFALGGEAAGSARDFRGAALRGAGFFVLGAAAAVWADRTRDYKELLVFLVPAAGFSLVYVRSFVAQMEQRDRAERQAERIEELTLRSERRRLGRELHDGLAQDLAGLVLQIDAAVARLDSGEAAAARAILDGARERAREALAQTRAAVDGLRSPAATEADFESLARDFSARTGVPCEASVDEGALLLLDGEAAAELAGIAKEALSNVATHAGARRVRLSLRREGGAVDLAVEDDGRGFDAAAAPERGRYGIAGMKERARLAGGTLSVESAPGRGARIVARIGPAEPRRG